MSRDEHELMTEFAEIGVFNINVKEFEKVKEDYRICKNRAEQLELFLARLVNAFQSEYSC